MRVFTRELYDQLEADEDSLYNTHFIRKGNGRGVRRIDEPAPALKAAQRFALQVLNNHARLLCHWRACGCIPRLDVRERVMQHAGWQWAITTDIKDFYPTVTFDMLANVRRIRTYMDLEDIRCCLRTINGQQVLPQGGPTSPMLANIAVIHLDEAIENMIQRWLGEHNDGMVGYMRFDLDPGRRREAGLENRALFSRYMDDVIISLDTPTREEANMVKGRLMDLIVNHGFTPNRRKTKLKPYYQKQKWIGFSLNGHDVMRSQPHVDKRYVNQVIDEGIQYVLEGRGDPFQDLSWGGKAEYIHYNNTGRYKRVQRKIALTMHVLGQEVPGHLRGTGVIAAHERRLAGTEEPFSLNDYFGNGLYSIDAGASNALSANYYINAGT